MQGDKMVGMSMFNGYSFNERCMLSLGVVALGLFHRFSQQSMGGTSAFESGACAGDAC